MESSVFECSICYSTYNDSSYKPLSLPCGHVYCEECINKLIYFSQSSTSSNVVPSITNISEPFTQHNDYSSTYSTPGDNYPQRKTIGAISSMESYIVCPSDKRVHCVTGMKLPVCYAILSNLPKEPCQTHPNVKKEVTCIRHPQKKVKFQCETHNEFLCSNCVLNHTGAGHIVSSFSIDYKKIKTDFDEILVSFEGAVTETLKIKEVNEANEKKLIEFYNCQLHKLTLAYDSAIKILNEKRKTFTEALRQHLYEQKKKFDHEKSKFLKKMDRLSDAIRHLQSFEQKLESCSYDEFYKLRIQKTQELKSVNEININKNFECQLAIFKDTVKLSDLGSIKLIQTTDLCINPNSVPETKDRAGSFDTIKKQNANQPESVVHIAPVSVKAPANIDTNLDEKTESIATPSNVCWTCKHCYSNNTRDRWICGTCMRSRQSANEGAECKSDIKNKYTGPFAPLSSSNSKHGGKFNFTIGCKPKDSFMNSLNTKEVTPTSAAAAFSAPIKVQSIAPLPLTKISEKAHTSKSPLKGSELESRNQNKQADRHYSSNNPQHSNLTHDLKKSIKPSEVQHNMSNYHSANAHIPLCNTTNLSHLSRYSFLDSSSITDQVPSLEKNGSFTHRGNITTVTPVSYKDSKPPTQVQKTETSVYEKPGRYDKFNENESVRKYVTAKTNELLQEKVSHHRRFKSKAENMPSLVNSSIVCNVFEVNALGSNVQNPEKTDSIELKYATTSKPIDTPIEATKRPQIQQEKVSSNHKPRMDSAKARNRNRQRDRKHSHRKHGSKKRNSSI